MPRLFRQLTRPWPRLGLAFLFMLTLVAAAFPAMPAAAAACTVTSTADTPSGGTLRQRLADATCSAISFNLPGSAPWTITVDSSLPTINRAVTLTGPGVDKLTVQGKDAFRVLLINAPGKAVAISDLTVAKGRAITSYGGNVRSLGGNVTLADVTLKTGTADAGFGGAGGYFTNGTIIMQRVTVSGNTAPGSLDYATGAGLHFDEFGGPLTANITDSTIKANVATSYGGGGIALVRDSGVAGRTLALTLANTTITQNSAGVGGGIYNEAGALNLNSSTLASNAAMTGGGLYAISPLGGENASVALIATVVSGNTASNGSGGGLNLHNHADSGSVSATLLGSTLSGNTSTSTGGGLGIVNASGVGGSATVTLVNSTVSGNQAGDSGGGLALSKSTGTGEIKGTVINSTISGNTTKGNGGGLVLRNAGNNGTATVALRFATVTGNKADSDKDSVGNGGGVTSEVSGGSIATLSSIVAGNTRGTGVPDDCGASVTSQGRNVWGDQAKCPNNAALGDQSLTALNVPIAGVLNTTLADNGGSAKTHALVAGSAAINHGDNVTCGLALPNGVGGLDQRDTPRNDGQCDAGAYEFVPAPSPMPSPSPQPSLSPLVELSLGTTGTGSGTIGANIAGAGIETNLYPLNMVVTLTPIPTTGSVFVGWMFDGQTAGWAQSVTVTMDTDHTLVAVFAPRPVFGDVSPDNFYYEPITELAARSIIRGCDQSVAPPNFCPADPTLRAQMAALLVRSMPGWAGEYWTNTFTDPIDDAELWGRVATLQHHNVAQGYQDSVCQERGLGVPCFGPLDNVTFGQAILFTSRALVQHGDWALQPDDRTIFPELNGAVGADPDTDRQTLDHRMIVTYLHYVGSILEVNSAPSIPFHVNGAAQGGWGDASNRAWFAGTLWMALNSVYGVDTIP